MNPALGLAAARIVVGGVALAAPGQGARLFRLDPVGNPQLPYLTRMFGSREVVLGAAALLTRGRTRQALVLAGVAVDLADAAAGHLAGAEKAVDRPTSILLAGSALAAVVAGIVGARTAV